MKKYILLLVLLSLSAITFAQNTDKMILYSEQMSTRVCNEKTGIWSDWSEPVDYNVYMVLDLTEQELVVHTEKNVTFYLVGVIDEMTPGKDKDGDTWKLFSFSALDDYSSACKVQLKMWDEFYITEVSIYYSDYNFAYMCKIKN
jgi:hypothetical protein